VPPRFVGDKLATAATDTRMNAARRRGLMAGHQASLNDYQIDGDDTLAGDQSEEGEAGPGPRERAFTKEGGVGTYRASAEGEECVKSPHRSSLRLSERAASILTEQS